MNASQVVKELQSLIDKHGDLPVRTQGEFTDHEVEDVDAYDNRGEDPDDSHPATEFFIW